MAAQLQRVLTGSRYCAALCQSRPQILRELLDSGDLERSYAERELSDALRSRLAACEDEAGLNSHLRCFRQRQMLRIIWRDFNRLAATLETTRDTSLLAESCINEAQRWWHAHLVKQHGEPRDSRGEAQQLIVLAMGKLGARELNLSSDVDLIFTYPAAGQTDGAGKAISNQEFFIKLGQRLIASIDQQTADGFVFRVDMRLRPYGDSGALVLNFAAMEEYYQDQGRDWERYALIKARPISGCERAGRFLLESLRPFIYRRYIDFGAIESLRDMKAMIGAEVRRRGLQEDVKLGPGGIREIEFIAQCFQLIRGGRSASLRRRELIPVLDALAAESCLPARAVAELKSAYLFLRDTEHAIQAYDDKQTQALPAAEAARAALLVALGFADWAEFRQCLDGHRARVSAHFAALIAPATGTADAPQEEAAWPHQLEPELLGQQGFADGEAAAAALLELRDSARLRHLQAEGRARLDQFMPRLLRACGEHVNSNLVLQRLLPLVQAVARRSAYLVLLMENPRALEELIQLCGASLWIAEQLSRNPVLLDELLDTRNLYSAANRTALREELQQQLARLAPDDLEANMEALRYFKSAQMLRIAASEVTGRLPLMQVSDKLSFLAEVIIEQALGLAWQDLTARYGEPQAAATDESEVSLSAARGFAVLGYGKLGGIELGHGSDLDLVFVYDAADRGVTDGARPIDNSVFYTRLGQRLIHILDTRTAMGQLYEVDMRLRPSGESGLLSASFKAFRDYQENRAWTWEHQALVRARFVAGDARLGRRCAEVRKRVLAAKRDERALQREVVAMRQKMREHSLPAAARDDKSFHLKQGRGGIVDIEFLVQFAVLAWSQHYPALTTWSDNIRILETLQQEALFSSEESQLLTDAYIAYRSAAHLQALQQQQGIVEAAAFAGQRRAVQASWERLLGDVE